ncbi:MAG: 3-deoxy-D-manno-octulosonic acid transferase, partial [Nonlabens sp.]
LDAFNHVFLQDQNYLMVAQELGLNNCTVNGDTRFDRASQLIERDNTTTLFERFVAQDLCLVIGSSWPEDIEVLKKWLYKNDISGKCKVMIAPHEVGEQSIKDLQLQLDYPTCKWSEINGKGDINCSTLIIDVIGQLTKAYSYASVAYVGGGMGEKGLHNILEAATFGIPIIIGKKYEKFPEAGKLEDLGGLYSISSSKEFEEIIEKTLQDDTFRNQTGMISGHWINSNTGATQSIINYLNAIDENFILD